MICREGGAFGEPWKLTLVLARTQFERAKYNIRLDEILHLRLGEVDGVKQK